VEPEDGNALITATLSKTDTLFEEESAVVPLVLEEDPRAEVSLSVDPEAKTLTLSGAFQATLPGTIEAVSTEDAAGHVAVFSGVLSDGTEIIVDATYTTEDMFAVVTLGTLGSEDFEVIVYGELVGDLAKVSTAYADMVRAAHKDEFGVCVDQVMTRSDTTATYQVGASITMNGVVAGFVSVYHQEQAENGDYFPIYVKVNSNCTNVANYLSQTEDLFCIYPDRVFTTCYSSSDKFRANSNMSAPNNGETTFSIFVPYATGIGALISDNISISFVFSSVEKICDSIESPTIGWNIYQATGWAASKMDGNYSTSTGMTMQAQYRYSGNVSTSLSAPLSVKASLRYIYEVYYGEGRNILHISTGEKTVYSTVTIVP